MFCRLKFIAAGCLLSGAALLVDAQVVSETLLREPSPLRDGDPVFERLAPERTGIDFENRFDHPRRWLELWKQYFNGSIGTGVALGDVNGDMLPDLFSVGKDSLNALFLNKGDFVFEDVTIEAGVAGGQAFGTGAAFVDIDNDGDLDLYVCYVAGANELFLNDGTGRFTESAEQWGLAFDSGSNAPSFADFDRDGDLDLYLQQNYLNGAGHLDGMPDVLFRNDGARFVDVTASAGIAGEGQGHTALWWDYNEDGWPDIYVSNDFEPVDKLYRNNNDGTFTDVIREELGGAPYSAMGVDLGDLNNDGHIDFLAAEMLARERDYYHQAVGPLSGKLISAKRSGVNQYMQNMLWSSVAPGRFVELSRYAGLHATNWTWASRFVDLDNDGLLDAFFANGMTRAFHDGDLAYKVSKARSLATRVRIFEVSPLLRERNLAFRNEGEFRFSDVGSEWGLDDEGVSFAAAFADFDLDGDLDLVTSNWKDGLAVYRNNSQQGRRLLVRLQGTSSNRDGLGAKVKLRTSDGVQTREVSSMRGYMSVDDPTLHFAIREGGEIESLEIEWPSGILQRIAKVGFGNRLLVRESETQGASAAPGVEPLFRSAGISIDNESWSGEDVFDASRGQFLLPFREDRIGPSLALVDLDGDGWRDVVLGGATGYPLRVFKNEAGQGLRFQENAGFLEDELAEDSSIVPLDFDEDGDLDLFVASGGVELDAGDEYFSDRIYENSGGLQFAEPIWRGRKAASASSILLNGELLLVAGGPIPGAYPRVESNELFRVEAGRLQGGEHPFCRSGRTTRLLAADLDGDGDDDVIQLREYAAPLAWRFDSSALVEWPEVFSGVGSGLWKSAAVADFNGDGRVDIALGNLGENNKYAVAPGSPAVLFAPKTDAAKGKYIEAETIDGKQYPRESRIFHQVDFPDLAERTGSYAAFAKMTVEEAFGSERIAQYDRFEFIERRSVLLTQEEGGGFTLSAFPGLVQAGAAIDLLAADFDEDGDADLVFALESVSPQPAAAIHPETSFLLCLRNDGPAGFRVVLPHESGLVLQTGQARRLAWIDLDGDGRGELLVSASEGPLAVFELND